MLHYQRDPGSFLCTAAMRALITGGSLEGNRRYTPPDYVRPVSKLSLSIQGLT